MGFLDFLKQAILDLCDCLSSLSMSFMGSGWNISFYKLILIVFFGGSAFSIVFFNHIDEPEFWDDDDDSIE